MGLRHFHFNPDTSIHRDHILPSPPSYLHPHWNPDRSPRLRTFKRLSSRRRKPPPTPRLQTGKAKATMKA